MSMVTFDAATQEIEVDFDGHTVKVGGVADARFLRRGATDGPESALWVSAQEAGVLVKMIEYILGKVKITPSSRAALESVLPRAREAAEPGAKPVETEAPTA